MIREAKIAQMNSIMQINTRHGMTTMRDAVYKLVQENIIDKDVAKAAIAEKGEDKDAGVGNTSGSGSF
jgi:Tfp pilus assembly pilus retraction ATPase PilT